MGSWLASLSSGLNEPQVKDVVLAAGVLTDKQEQILADSVLDVVTLANSEVVESLKEGEENMAKTLYEIMKPEIDEAIEKARMEAIAEGTAFGMEKGLETGKELGTAEAVQSVVRRFLTRGGFSPEDIAEISGATLEEAQALQASMGAVLV